MMVGVMNSVADLLELSSDEDVARGLQESRDTVMRWRIARAIPESRARDLVTFALLQGHLAEVARIAAHSADIYSDVGALLHDLGKPNSGFQGSIRTPGRDDAPDRETRPITRILDDMQHFRARSVDPVDRVRALRAEWDARDDDHGRIRAGDVV